MICAWISKKRSRKDLSSIVRPSRSASFLKASMIPFSQSIRVP
jgi:hypothetical protein